LPRPPGGLGHLAERQVISEESFLPVLVEPPLLGRELLFTSTPLLTSIHLQMAYPLARSVVRGNVEYGRSLPSQEHAIGSTARQATPVEEVEGRQEIPYVSLVQQLVETDRIPAARRVLQALPLALQNDPVVRRLRAVLAPPVVRRTERRDRDRRAEYDWLKTQAHRYRGQWVAVSKEKLLAAAPTLRELREQLGTLRLTERPLLHRIE
jgi:hypothetical protein